MSNDGELIPIHEIKTREERAYRAYQLRLGGSSWMEVADKLDYPNSTKARSEVDLLVTKAIGTINDDRKVEIVDLELDRLDALQSAVWGMAMGGDLKAVDSALKIMAHRARLLMLGQESHSTTSTIIVAGDDYAETLKGIAN